MDLWRTCNIGDLNTIKHLWTIYKIRKHLINPLIIQKNMGFPWMCCNYGNQTFISGVKSDIIYRRSLIRACASGYFNMVKFMWKKIPNMIQYNHYGAFRMACRSNNMKLIKWIWNKNPSTKMIKTLDGMVLYEAVYNNHDELIKWLWNKCRNVNLFSEYSNPIISKIIDSLNVKYEKMKYVFPIYKCPLIKDLCFS